MREQQYRPHTTLLENADGMVQCGIHGYLLEVEKAFIARDGGRESDDAHASCGNIQGAGVYGPGDWRAIWTPVVREQVRVGRGVGLVKDDLGTIPRDGSVPDDDR